MQADFEFMTETAELLRVIAHPVRLCIIMGLAEKEECNVSHMQHCLKKPQSTISQHLQKLKAAGLISADRRGLEVYYRIADQRIYNILEGLTAKGQAETRPLPASRESLKKAVRRKNKTA